MDEKDQAVRARRVTCALAELDFLFSLVRKEGTEERLWDLGPFLPDDKKSGPVNVRLAFNGNWLVALSSATLKEKPDSQLLLKLLELPLKMPLARVALSESSTPEGSKFDVVITSDVAEARLDAPSLKESIGAVIGCAQMVEGLGVLKEDETAGELTLPPARPRRPLRNRRPPRR